MKKCNIKNLDILFFKQKDDDIYKLLLINYIYEIYIQV